MTTTTSSSQWRFVFNVLIPVLVSLVATFGIVGGLIYLSAKKSDEQALKRQRTLVAHTLTEQRAALRQQQANVVGWDDAMQAVTGDVDLEWITRSLGEELHEANGHDRAFLLNPSLEPVFAMNEGKSAPLTEYEKFRTDFTPFVARLREIDWQGALGAYSNGQSQVIPSVGDIMSFGGQPALVSFMPLASDSGRYIYRPGQEYIHIAIQNLDDELAAELGENLLLNGATFTLPSADDKSFASVPLFNQFNQTIALFSWNPNNPGAGILRESAPAVVGAFAIMVLIITALMYGLRQSTAQLESGRAQAQHMAFHDKLTGLANRALFEDRLVMALAGAHRGNQRIALLMIDLDRFKQVNDSLGHAAGDQLIQQVADRLRSLLRDTDTIARLGGDEFAVIQTNVTSIADVNIVASRIIEAISEPFNVASSQAFVGASIGVALAPEADTEGVELTRKADIALYEAKAAGRNQHKIFEDRMSEAVQRRQTIEAELREALVTGEGLEVEFHPLFRNDDSVVIAVQAEMVWTHHQLGKMPSASFTQVAESCGLIEKIGEFVLKHACELGAANSALRISVKAFPAQLRNPLFFNQVYTILDETGMQPEQLEIEICEKMLSETEVAATATLRKLRHSGINIALGDFGTGFGSLRLLQKFQVDRIKIDRSFIEQLQDSPDPEAITHAVVWLARAIGVEVSADGVDTAEQKKFLARMGCTSFQGALFSPQGQAELLRQVSHVEERSTPRTAPQDDIELWG